MIDRIHLEIIEALTESGSLTGAAERLNLTQSALTHSIKKLEMLTGAVIWEKEGRRLRLTEAGTMLLDSSRRLLPQFRLMEKRLRQFGEGKLGTLIIGVECHPCFEWLVKIIHAYLKEWPDIELDVTRSFQFSGLEALENHKVNMLVTPDYLEGEGFARFEILDFELQLMVAKDHRLAADPYLNPADLSEEVLYTYPIDRSRLDIFSLDVKPLKHVPVEATEIMVQLVSAGRGVSTFPDWLIRKYAEEYPLTGIPLKKGGFSKKLYLMVREEDCSIPFIRGFIELAESARR